VASLRGTAGGFAMRFLAEGLVKVVTRCALVTFAVSAQAQPVMARTFLHCSMTEVVITSTSAGDTSSRSAMGLRFVIDDGAKTLTFADGRVLAVTRLDDNWISASRDDIFYEYDRQGRTLSYAGSTTKNAVTTIIVGSGRCEAMGG
jgi:hypothetical protein